MRSKLQILATGATPPDSPKCIAKRESSNVSLVFFYLGGIDTEIYDEEYLDGEHYWKETGKAHDEEGEDESESKSPED